MRPFFRSPLLTACFLCFAAVAGAQQTQGTAAITAFPRLVRFAGSFHPPVNQPTGPVGANVEVDANGNYNLPRVLVVIVPHALKAGDADTLGGRPAAAYALAGSSTLAQPARPVAAVAVETTAAPVPAIASSGSPNYIAKFTDTAGDVGNSAMYQSGAAAPPPGLRWILGTHRPRDLGSDR